MLLEYRPDAGVPEYYQNLLPPLLQPHLWESSGNVPALMRLLQAYLQKDGRLVVERNHLPAFLGVFQKLMASKVNDTYGFELLKAIFEFVPLYVLPPPQVVTREPSINLRTMQPVFASLRQEPFSAHFEPAHLD